MAVVNLAHLRWTFVDEGDPVVSAIRSIRDLFPNVRFKCEPDTTLKVCICVCERVREEESIHTPSQEMRNVWLTCVLF